MTERGRALVSPDERLEKRKCRAESRECHPGLVQGVRCAIAEQYGLVQLVLTHAERYAGTFGQRSCRAEHHWLGLEDGAIGLRQPIAALRFGEDAQSDQSSVVELAGQREQRGGLVSLKLQFHLADCFLTLACNDLSSIESNLDFGIILQGPNQALDRDLELRRHLGGVLAEQRLDRRCVVENGRVALYRLLSLGPGEQPRRTRTIGLDRLNALVARRADPQGKPRLSESMVGRVLIDSAQLTRFRLARKTPESASASAAPSIRSSSNLTSRTFDSLSSSGPAPALSSLSEEFPSAVSCPKSWAFSPAAEGV